MHVTGRLIEEMRDCATTVIISIYMFPNYYIFFALLIYYGWAVLASCIYVAFCQFLGDLPVRICIMSSRLKI